MEYIPIKYLNFASIDVTLIKYEFNFSYGLSG